MDDATVPATRRITSERKRLRANQRGARERDQEIETRTEITALRGKDVATSVNGVIDLEIIIEKKHSLYFKIGLQIKNGKTY